VYSGRLRLKARDCAAYGSTWIYPCELHEIRGIDGGVTEIQSAETVYECQLREMQIDPGK